MKHTMKLFAALALLLALALSLPVVAEEVVVEEPVSESTDEVILSPDAEESVELAPEIDLFDGEVFIPEENSQVEAAPAEAEANSAAVEAQPNAASAIPSKLTLGVKETYKIDTTGLKGKITFKSSKTKIATVSKKGVIKAKKAGKTKITITPKKGKKKTITVTVKKAPKKITMDEKSVTLAISDTYELSATLPAKTASNKITWTSNKPGIVKITYTDGGYCELEALKAGTATITVKTFNGKKATCKVTVRKAENLSVDKTSVSVKAGNKVKVNITCLGDGNLSWDSSNDNIAYCDWEDGWNGNTTGLYIFGMGSGSAVITVSDDDTGDQVKIKVTVTGQTEIITELGKLMFKDIATANSMLAHKLKYYKENMYICDGEYFSVLVENGVIRTVGFFNDFGDYKLMGIWPTESISNALSYLNNTGWTLKSDESQIGTFTNSELPGCILQFKYSNGEVDYIMVTM